MSQAIAAFIAHGAFWILLAYGLAVGELTVRGVSVFLCLWLAGLFGLPYVPVDAARAMFAPVVALLDIALAFVIFKGDVRLT